MRGEEIRLETHFKIRFQKLLTAGAAVVSTITNILALICFYTLVPTAKIVFICNDVKIPLVIKTPSLKGED